MCFFDLSADGIFELGRCRRSDRAPIATEFPYFPAVDQVGIHAPEASLHNLHRSLPVHDWIIPRITCQCVAHIWCPITSAERHTACRRYVLVSLPPINTLPSSGNIPPEPDAAIFVCVNHGVVLAEFLHAFPGLAALMGWLPHSTTALSCLNPSRSHTRACRDAPARVTDAGDQGLALRLPARSLLPPPSCLFDCVPPAASLRFRWHLFPIGGARRGWKHAHLPPAHIPGDLPSADEDGIETATFDGRGKGAAAVVGIFPTAGQG